MGGDNVKSEGTGESVRSMAKYLPKLLQATSENVGPYEQALVNARGNIDPQNLALDESLARYFMPRFSQIGSDIQRQEAMNTANTELGVLSGPGAAMVREGNALNREVDPEYYATRAVGAQKLTDLLNGQDPNRLTGAEMANVERGLNRTNMTNGTLNVPASGSAIKNAMTFGSALDTKRNTLLNTINAVPQNLAAMKSGFDAFQVATGRPSYGANPTTGQYATGRQGFGQNVSGMGMGLLGEAGQNVRQTQQLNAQKKDGFDKFSQVMGSLPSC